MQTSGILLPLLWKPSQSSSMLIRLSSSAFGNISVTESWMSVSLGNSRCTVKVNFDLDLFCIQSLNAELAEIPSCIAKLIAGSFVLCFSVWRVMLAENGADSHRCAGMKELHAFGLRHIFIQTQDKRSQTALKCVHKDS